MEKYSRDELAGLLRGLEAGALQGQGGEQVMGMDAAAFASMMHQAACMVMECHRPVISANRVLTLAELLGIYHTDAAHDWPSNTPPYLYHEEKGAPGQWMPWCGVREIVEGRSADVASMNNYFKAWRLWLCKPTDGEGQSVPWED